MQLSHRLPNLLPDCGNGHECHLQVGGDSREELCGSLHHFQPYGGDGSLVEQRGFWESPQGIQGLLQELAAQVRILTCPRRHRGRAQTSAGSQGNGIRQPRLTKKSLSASPSPLVGLPVCVHLGLAGQVSMALWCFTDRATRAAMAKHIQNIRMYDKSLSRSRPQHTFFKIQLSLHT